MRPPRSYVDIPAASSSRSAAEAASAACCWVEIRASACVSWALTLTVRLVSARYSRICPGP
eukprot:2632561-Prymnesium_polylepis.1